MVPVSWFFLYFAMGVVRVPCMALRHGKEEAILSYRHYHYNHPHLAQLPLPDRKFPGASASLNRNVFS